MRANRKQIDLIRWYQKNQLDELKAEVTQVNFGFSCGHNALKNINHLKQVHGKTIVEAGDETAFQSKARPSGDGIFCRHKDSIIAVKTADCLPILITDEDTLAIALHAGWRGLAKGITQQAFELVSQLDVNIKHLKVILGPAITPQNYEVSEEVICAFEDSPLDFNDQELAFGLSKSKTGKWQIDLSLLAAIHAIKSGLNGTQIHLFRSCTYADHDLWPSYRRQKPHDHHIWSWIQL